MTLWLWMNYSCPNLRYLPKIFLEGLRKNIKCLIPDTKYFGLNPRSPRYEAGITFTRLQHSLEFRAEIERTKCLKPSLKHSTSDRSAVVTPCPTVCLILSRRCKLQRPGRFFASITEIRFNRHFQNG